VCMLAVVCYFVCLGACGYGDRGRTEPASTASVCSCQFDLFWNVSSLRLIQVVSLQGTPNMTILRGRSRLCQARCYGGGVKADISSILRHNKCSKHQRKMSHRSCDTTSAQSTNIMPSLPPLCVFTCIRNCI